MGGGRVAVGAEVAWWCVAELPRKRAAVEDYYNGVEEDEESGRRIANARFPLVDGGSTQES